MVPPDASGTGSPTENSGAGGRSESFQEVARWLGFRRGTQPVVTMSLIAMCVLVAFAELISQQVGASLVFAPIVGESQPYRFVGSTFLHAGFWHLLFNMYALWLIGSALEPIIGRVRFLAIYLLSAVAGNIAVLLTADPSGQSWVRATAGASGAVFGLFGALFLLVRHFGSDATSLLVVLVANLALGFVPGMNISWQSHVGGLIMGGALMGLMMMGRNQPGLNGRRWHDTWIIVLAIAVLVGLFFWGYR